MSALVMVSEDLRRPVDLPDADAPVRPVPVALRAARFHAVDAVGLAATVFSLQPCPEGLASAVTEAVFDPFGSVSGVTVGRVGALLTFRSGDKPAKISDIRDAVDHAAGGDDVAGLPVGVVTIGAAGAALADLAALRTEIHRRGAYMVGSGLWVNGVDAAVEMAAGVARLRCLDVATEIGSLARRVVRLRTAGMSLR